MTALEAVRLALQVLAAQKLKSAFSAIGVFIGVTFLIGAWSIVNGMNRYMTEKFAGTLVGVNTFHVRRRPNFTPTVSDSTSRSWARRPRITFEDADAVTNGITLPVLTAWWSEDRGAVAYGRRLAKDVSLQGATERYFEIRNIKIQEGRAFTPQEARAGSAVLVMGYDDAGGRHHAQPAPPASAPGRQLRARDIGRGARFLGKDQPHPARRGPRAGADRAGGRRDRHHEHHAHGRGGAHPGDRPSQVARRAPPRHPAAVPRRIGHAGP